MHLSGDTAEVDGHLEPPFAPGAARVHGPAALPPHALDAEPLRFAADRAG